MQLLLSFSLKQPKIDPEVFVWATLDIEQRNETLRVLARLIAQAVTAGYRQKFADKTEEHRDE